MTATSVTTPRSEAPKPSKTARILFSVCLYTPFLLVLSIAGPVAWIWYQGGMDAVGWIAKGAVFVLPVCVLVFDIVDLERRSSQPGFDPWSEI